MAYAASRLAGSQSAVTVTLGSVVMLHDEYGLVWHATRDVLRVLPIRIGRRSLPLSLANEVALHLPNSAFGWGVVCDELVSWPRAYCNVIGEVDERCLLKAMETRRSVAPALAPAIIDKRLSADTHLAA